MDAGAALTAFVDLVTAGAAIAVAVVAANGLQTWRRELRGKAEYDLARRALRAVYEVRDMIAHVRNPMMLGGEIKTAFDEAEIELEKPTDPRTDEVVYEHRWRALQDAMSDLEAEAVEAEVLWGENAKRKIKGIRQPVAELYGALLQHLARQQAAQVWQRIDPGDVEKTDRIIYQVSSDPKEDEFLAKVNAAVEAAEDLLRPHLKA